MSAETWSTYQVMINRATAVCAAIGQKQFRAMAEMTVNNLMESLREQSTVMQELSDHHRQLKASTLVTTKKLSEDLAALLGQQMDLLQLTETQKYERNREILIFHKYFFKKGTF